MADVSLFVCINDIICGSYEMKHIVKFTVFKIIIKHYIYNTINIQFHIFKIYTFVVSIILLSQKTTTNINQL